MPFRLSAFKFDNQPGSYNFNLANYSHHNIGICGLPLHHRNTESRQNLEQKSIFQQGTLSPTGSMNASHSTDLFPNSCDHTSTNGKVPLQSHINLQHSTITLFALTKDYRSKRPPSISSTVKIQPQNFCNL